MDMASPTVDSSDLHGDVDPKTPLGPGQITIIFNPTAGRRRRRKLDAALRALAELGFTATVIETSGPGDAERIARHAAMTDRSIVVVAGGDGTINEAVNGLLSAPGPLPPLAIIPLGTANVLAQEIGLGTDPRAAARAIAGGRRLSFQPGRVNGRHFVLMVGAGFDGAVVAGVSTLWKRRIGRLAYAVRTTIEAFAYPFPLLNGSVDGRPFAARWAVVCRGRHYGGPFVVAPSANLAQPRLTVCLLPGGGPWAVLRYGIAMLTGTLPKLSDLTVETGTVMRIETGGDLPVQGDGDIVARLPIEIGIADRTIDLIVP
jgi:YegS/Rv2252/BmrU family lipid kinase